MVAIDAPGLPLAAELTSARLADLATDELFDVVAGWERLRSWAEACQNDVLVELGHRLERTSTTGWEARAHAEELGVVLGVGAASAAARANLAADLAERLPNTRAALAAGRITGHHARLIAGATRPVDVPTAQAVDAALAADAEAGRWRTPRQAETCARRHVVTLDPCGADQRHRKAVEDRDVRLRPGDDGMCTLWALLPAAEAQTVASAIESRARSSAGRPDSRLDTRTLAQRRADALVAMAADALAAPDAPAIHGLRPTVNITVPWSALIGCDQAPGDLTGYGPIDVFTARRIAADPTATWRRLLVDPATGALLDVGRTVYRPPPDLLAFVLARDAYCRGPGCDHGSATCDIDHRQRWTDLGPTAAVNLDPLCRAIHRLKDEGGWVHKRAANGDSIWTLPSGRTVTRAAHRLPHGAPIEPPGSGPGSGRGQGSSDVGPTGSDPPPPY